MVKDHKHSFSIHSWSLPPSDNHCDQHIIIGHRGWGESSAWASLKINLSRRYLLRKTSLCQTMSLHWSLSIQIRYRFIHTHDSKSKCQLSKSSPYLSALHIPTCTIITIIIIIPVFENQGSLVSLRLQVARSSNVSQCLVVVLMDLVHTGFWVCAKVRSCFFRGEKNSWSKSCWFIATICLDQIGSAAPRQCLLQITGFSWFFSRRYHIFLCSIRQLLH